MSAFRERLPWPAVARRAVTLPALLGLAVIALTFGCQSPGVVAPGGSTSVSIRLDFGAAAPGLRARAAARTTDYDLLLISVFGESQSGATERLALVTVPLADSARAFSTTITVPTARRYRVQARLYGGDSDRGLGGRTGRGLLFMGEETANYENGPPILVVRMADVVPRLTSLADPVTGDVILRWERILGTSAFVLYANTCGPLDTLQLGGGVHELVAPSGSSFRMRSVFAGTDTSALCEDLEVNGCLPDR